MGTIESLVSHKIYGKSKQYIARLYECSTQNDAVLID